MAFLDKTGVTSLVAKLKTIFQLQLVSGKNIKTINGNTILGPGDLSTSDPAKQDKLVAGVNIKTINGKTLLDSGNLEILHNTWYGTCGTGAGTQTKVVTTSSRDFNLKTGSMVRVQFTNAQTYNGGIKLDVDGTGEHNVMRQGTTATARYFFLAGEVVDFVYDGANYIAVNEGIATTTYYGVTKLSSATNSSSASMAATPAAVKAAYDHADTKQEQLVSGTNIKTINNHSLLGSGNISIVNEAEEFTGTRSNAIYRGECFGTYDQNSNSVTLIYHFYNNSDIPTSYTLFTIPEKYRPKTTKYGGAFYTVGSSWISYNGYVTSGGIVKQDVSGQCRSGFGVIKYVLD